MLEVSEITNLSEFERLKDIWNKVLQKSADPDVFSTWEWIWCWWTHYGKDRKLRILVAEENGEISGIAPLMLSKYSFFHLCKISKIEFIGSSTSDYNSFILVKNEKKCLNLFLSKLMKVSDWNLMELRDIRENTVFSNTLTDTCVNIFPRMKIAVGTVCPYIKLPQSVELFNASFSRNMRRNLRKRMNKLRKAYDVKIVTHRDFNSVEEAMEVFFSLHQKRWSSKGEPGAFASETFRDFHLDLAKTFDSKGWLALYFLMANDKPISTVYSFDYNNKKYGYLTGFDPEFSRYSSGNLLKNYVAKECIKNGFREYDLMRDFEQYKADWATNVRENYVATIISNGLFTKTYNWSLQNGLTQLLINRFRAHLTLDSI